MKNKLDNFHYHEALDRLYLICDLVTLHLSKHPAIKKHRKVRKRVKKAEKLLAEAYQLIGGISYEKFH